MSKWQLHLGMLGRGRLEDIHATFSILKMYFYFSLLLYTFYRSDYNNLDANNFYFFTDHTLEWYVCMYGLTSFPLEELLIFKVFLEMPWQNVIGIYTVYALPVWSLQK